MIKINNISFSYGNKEVLNDFSLNINVGDKICLFGESGCGKTTLIRLLLGLETPNKGNISGLLSIKPSVVFQENRLLPFKTVLENITILGVDKEKALTNLKALGIDEIADQYPDNISGGQQRRVAIARALSANYDYLLLDEPFNGLDSTNIELAATHILKNLNERPLIVVTHSLEEASLLNAKIINM